MVNDEIKRLENLYNIYEHIDYNNSNSTESIRAFDTWYNESLVLFDKFYDDNDRFYLEFSNIELVGLNGFCKHGIFSKLSGKFKVLIDRIKRESKKMEDNNIGKTKVFIVHGHDNLTLESVKNLILILGLTPVVLNQKANSGLSLLEKLEKYTDVGFAIILYTPCDKGKEYNSKRYNVRARQNVVFEHGYLIAKLGKENIAVLKKGNIEMPSDIDGIAYVEGGEWRYKIADEMIAAGYDVDKNKIV